MLKNLVYLQLELKRAWKRLPHIYAGAIALFFMMGAIALLSSRTLYGDAVTGRITVGVVLPGQDSLSKQVMRMVGSLGSVKSLCDFEYADRNDALQRLQDGELYAVMEFPEGLVKGIMDGTNSPIRILLPADAGLEGQIFRELTDAGARTLGASQAGIYAGNELCRFYGMDSSVGQLEADLNRIYLGYSLPRSDYFRHRTQRATGDVDIIPFYGISACVLFLLLCAIPVSSYLLPCRPAFARKLAVCGITRPMRVAARILGLTLLLASVTLPLAAAAMGMGWISGSLMSVCTLLLVCMAAASLVALCYQAAGTLMGGILLLLLVGIGQHFLAGGFLPLVFLPEAVRKLAPFLPSTVLMNGLQMTVTAEWNPVWFGALGILILIGLILGVGLEVERE